MEHRTMYLAASGGVGCTTVAALHAAARAAAGHATLLWSHDPGAMCATLGAPEDSIDGGEIAPNLGLTSDPALAHVADYGQTQPADLWAVGPFPRGLLVLRGPSYIGLRAAVQILPLSFVAGAVIVAEEGRPLSKRDVEDVLSLSVVATVDVTPSTARQLDAGLLLSRLARRAELGYQLRAASYTGAGVSA